MSFDTWKLGIADLSHEIFVESRAKHGSQQKFHGRIKQRRKLQFQGTISGSVPLM
jgi:hypothetical protein